MSEPPTVDFDHHSPGYARTWMEQFQELREKCPVAWSEHHDGFWVVTRYDDVAQVARDDITFSSDNDLADERGGGQGIVIPRSPMRSVPIEMDPPEFLKYRRILNPPFAPAALKTWEPFLQDLVTACLDKVIETGTADFVLDLANPVPAIFTLAFLGISLDNWEGFATPFHDVVAYPPGSPGHDRAVEGQMWIIDRILEEVAARRTAPRDDLVTYLVQSEVDGEPIEEARVVEMIFLILAGGVDTTTALIAQGIKYLDEHPEDRRRLIDDPSLIANACEEFLRYYTPTQNLARTVTADVEIGGRAMCPGERVLMSWASINHDPAMFDRPNEVIIDRFPNRHAAFGLGAHRCLGSNFTRVEFRIMLEEVLKRMPDYALDPTGTEPYENIGIVNGFRHMAATFTPGTRLGSKLHL